MQKYIFSADKNAFFPVELKIAYQESGEWPDDGIEIDDTVAAEFMKEAPEGKYRGVIDGMPAWIDIPPPALVRSTISSRSISARAPMT
ncbi:phage tail fiber assembly protein [Salmonella enterica subsp. enterica serovar Typhi]|nr:phage tail fiber assembly protein [Salmonella enterica subsp. enterica serovar Typhi]